MRLANQSRQGIRTTVACVTLYRWERVAFHPTDSVGRLLIEELRS